MTNKILFRKLSVIINFLLIYSFNLFSGDWIIGAQKFSINSKDLTVAETICETLPESILDALGNKLSREITPDEKNEREIYKLEKENQSLFLQLSAEHKKRNSLVLGNYTPRELKNKIEDSEKKISEIEQKIQKNFNEQKLLYQKTEEEMAMLKNGDSTQNSEKSEFQKWRYLFRNLFVKEDPLTTQETIAFYKNNSAYLFEAPQNFAYDSPLFEKAVIDAGINTLITGNIVSYGDYVLINVEAWLYPGCKKISSVSEVGSVKELDSIASLIAQKLVPAITNSLPVSLQITVKPQKNYSFYIDDVLQNISDGKIVLQSGVHRIQIKAEGYRTSEVSYYFEGNRNYNLEVELEEQNVAYLYLKLKNPLDAENIANAESVLALDDFYSKIKINGQPVLGQLISEDGKKLFYYVPQNLAFNDNVVLINAKLKNNSEYIEKRRKWMYGTYSLLLVSLIPTFYTYGKTENFAGQYYQFVDRNDSEKAMEYYDKGIKWQKGYQITSGISIGCGVLFGFELIRYLIAANSVLPKEVRKTNIQFDESLLLKPEPPEDVPELKKKLKSDNDDVDIDLESGE